MLVYPRLKSYEIPCLFANDQTIVLAATSGSNQSNHPRARSLSSRCTDTQLGRIRRFQEEESKQKHTWIHDDTRFRCSVVDTHYIVYIYNIICHYNGPLVTLHSHGKLPVYRSFFHGHLHLYGDFPQLCYPLVICYIAIEHGH